MRKTVLRHIDGDIIAVNETHLKGTKCVEMPGYMWYGYNRQQQHVRVNKGSGGVGILVKRRIAEEYDIKIVDREIDGLLMLKFTHKVTLYSLLMVCAYLPPENSPWGRDATGFYSHVLSRIYDNIDCDAVCIMGDLNARVGDKADFIEGIDDITPRRVLDNVSNKHGDALLEFLLSSKMCLLNGRVTPEYDNYTSISTKGSAVVDYCAVPRFLPSV